MKALVYGDAPQTVQHFKHNIERAVRGIDPAICGRAIDNFNKIVRHCLTSKGRHIVLIQTLVRHDQQPIITFLAFL